MSLRDLCDVVYVRLIEQLERRAAALAAALAPWNEKALSLAEDMRRDFDQALIASPDASKSKILLRQLGVS